MLQPSTFSRPAMGVLAGGIGLLAAAIAFNLNQQGAAQAGVTLGGLAVAVGWILVGVDAYRRGGRTGVRPTRDAGQLPS